MNQTIIFTVMPRGMTVDPEPMPVSVYVSPRLTGADRLGAFADWTNWTRHLEIDGLTLDLRCGAQTLSVPIDPTALRVHLWAELFNESTLVRSHTFDDYSDRAVLSYGVRQTLSALKAVYQEASVALALPDAGGPNRDGGNRETLRGLVDGLGVNWNGDIAGRWRQASRVTPASADNWGWREPLGGPHDSEGLIAASPDSGALQNLAVPFSVFHHMPTPAERDQLKIDPATLLDFHQALTSLNSYPDLLRALGIILDLDLPREFVGETTGAQFGTLAVTGATAGWGWSLVPDIPALETAYLHLPLGAKRYFFAAPRAFSDPQAPTAVLGLLSLDESRFGLAQVDVDGAMHKAIMLAESLSPPAGHNFDPYAQPEAAPHPEIFDPGATLPALRSGGLSLFADRRALALLDTLSQSKAFNDAVANGTQAQPFFADDLVRGYRLDVWDSRTDTWHSLHLRHADYQVGAIDFVTTPDPEEGFVQLALTQPAKGAQPVTDDLYLHEAIARWAGWSLSVPRPSRHLSRYPDAADALPDPSRPQTDFSEDEPITPFKVTARHQVVAGSLPRLRFGGRYRIRARAMDLAGNGLQVDDPLAALLTPMFALPQDPEGFAYLRFEPVPAPLVIIRDPKAVTEPGSAADRLVLRTFNAAVGLDAAAADTTAADRHIVPPRTAVEIGERLGMFDDATGQLKADASTWKLISDRDAGEFNQATFEIAGKSVAHPIEAAARIDALPHLPDPLARGAALRDLPGSPTGSIGTSQPSAGAAAPIRYTALSDPNPRPGSATLVGFGGPGDWEAEVGFRLSLAEPQPGQMDLGPAWDPAERVLTVYLPKAATVTVPLTSYMTPDDLKLMGVWQWLRQYIERITVSDPRRETLRPGTDVDRIAHVLQRAVEGGHWMLTPPRLLTLVHAVQQPLGIPEFTALGVQHQDPSFDAVFLQTAPDRGRRDPTELAPISAWRRPGATDAYLLGALKVNGASTANIELQAEWDEPVDDTTQPKPAVAGHAASVDELPLKRLAEGYISAAGTDARPVGYYDPEHDQIAFVRAGDRTGTGADLIEFFFDAAPRHTFNDTKHHVVRYRAVAKSRFREYFAPNLDFTRTSEEVVVDVPASARPLAPDVVYVVPTFGWQRQTQTNLKRSVRFGGGLRVYLRRPWFSSGAGELLGIALWDSTIGSLDSTQLDKFKPFITQWGMDPIWHTAGLGGVPGTWSFPSRPPSATSVTLEEASARDDNGDPGRVDVVGFEPQFDEVLGLWYADLTIETFTETYTPFVRLALVRYQPHALADTQISRVVLADFVQLTHDRAVTVTTDPHHPRTIRVAVSGVAPTGPVAVVRAEPRPQAISNVPTQIVVRVQSRTAGVDSDLAWQDVDPAVAEVRPDVDGHLASDPDLVLWAGAVAFADRPTPGSYRLLLEEREFISADYALAQGDKIVQPSRPIFAETVELDEALIGGS